MGVDGAVLGIASEGRMSKVTIGNDALHDSDAQWFGVPLLPLREEI